eukprot:991363-Prorocentrum_minimum.AAC.2
MGPPSGSAPVRHLRGEYALQPLLSHSGTGEFGSAPNHVFKVFEEKGPSKTALTPGGRRVGDVCAVTINLESGELDTGREKGRGLWGVECMHPCRYWHKRTREIKSSNTTTTTNK